MDKSIEIEVLYMYNRIILTLISLKNVFLSILLLKNTFMKLIVSFSLNLYMFLNKKFLKILKLHTTLKYSFIIKIKRLLVIIYSVLVVLKLIMK